MCLTCRPTLARRVWLTIPQRQSAWTKQLLWTGAGKLFRLMSQVQLRLRLTMVSGGGFFLGSPLQFLLRSRLTSWSTRSTWCSWLSSSWWSSLNSFITGMRFIALMLAGTPKRSTSCLLLPQLSIIATKTSSLLIATTTTGSDPQPCLLIVALKVSYRQLLYMNTFTLPDLSTLEPQVFLSKTPLAPPLSKVAGQGTSVLMVTLCPDMWWNKSLIY